ncbi:hypothetical protein PV327_007549 [Microctonus hyperodae]|uniref:tRNA-specific adenosine deaminase 1 n=1 Tax=Microctonus hyperodae TaxID=165561 RepID=A0AA39FZE6_MICHY|nr:hypothetical protein PV327_007549 [Microctonus hyperodae]
MLNVEDNIAKLCIDKYNSLKKTGKPIDNEWTVLAGIVLKNEIGNLSVVSLATGTKCLGINELTNTNLYNIGERLNDSHAEILTRRALLRYFYDQIDQLFSSTTSNVFVLNNNRQIELKKNISFYFYCSQTPCGDCSIIPKIQNQLTNDLEIPPLKIPKLNNDKTTLCLIINDLHRTGAKCVETEIKQDNHLPGVNYHVVGPLRTKPGRGDATLSLSCSDKIAKWNILGIQGALLSLIIPKIKLEIIVIGGGCPFSLEAMERGVYKRFHSIDKYNIPKIYQSSLAFAQMKSQERINPCPSSIIWCAVSKRNFEVAVDGRKQGATKNKRGNYLLVTRKSLFMLFLNTIDKHPYFKNLPSHPKIIEYYHCKQWSIEYQQLWNYLKLTIFKTWPIKPMKLQQFSV